MDTLVKNDGKEVQQGEISTSIKGNKSEDFCKKNADKSDNDNGTTIDVPAATYVATPTENKIYETSGDNNSNKIDREKEQQNPISESTLQDAVCEIQQPIKSECLNKFDHNQGSSHETTDDLLKESFELHPFKELLINFRPTDEQLSVPPHVEPPKSIAETPFDEISTKESLNNFVTALKQTKEIGVDVEYSDHGYKEVCCLIQISTSSKDYLIYAMELQNELEILNEVFTDPSIVKIFHAATNDLKWLQGIGIFVVNMFDTQKALKMLGHKNLGLGDLLKSFNVFKDKSLQRADFRKRPLPPNYKDYARIDSHYLIPIYHKLRKELNAQNLLYHVFNKCNDDCKIFYKSVDDKTYLSILTDIKKRHDHQLNVLEKLNKWRHEIAKYLDQNPGTIVSKNQMKALVIQMPTNPNDILKIVKTKYVKEHMNEILNIMKGDMDLQTHFINARSRGKQDFNRKRKMEETDFSRNQKFPLNKRFKGHGNPSHDTTITFQDDSFDLRRTLKTGRKPRYHKRGY